MNINNDLIGYELLNAMYRFKKQRSRSLSRAFSKWVS